MTQRSAIKKSDLFAEEAYWQKLDKLGDLLAKIDAAIVFAVLATEVDRVTPRTVSPQGSLPPYPTEVMVRTLVLKRPYNLLDKQ
jgi:hypothetical protein